MASNLQGGLSWMMGIRRVLAYPIDIQALVLLEYLVKNGSERVIDDARSHISMIKIMRNFHYIDEKGKDQGINSKWKGLSFMMH